MRTVAGDQMETAFIALGSNLGERRGNLDRAQAELRADPAIEISACSSYYETAPVDCPPGSPAFVNAAAKLKTTLSPRELLTALLKIEDRLGRVRSERNAPRPIDLDLLLYEEQVVSQPQAPALELPHPRLHERWFVLAPLAEIAPDAVHPVRRQTVRQMLQAINPVRDVLKGKRALVTGSTSGIGQAIVELLAQAGAAVLVHGRRSQDRAEEVARRCAIHGRPAQVLMADLRDAAARAKLALDAWSAWDGLDILINNAGTDTLTGAAAHWPFERKLQELWAVDVEATMFLSRHVGDRMKAAGGGVIVNLGWDQAETGMAGDSGQLFGAVKGAVMCFSRSLAASLAPEVRVNCVAPGWIKTAWGEGASHYWQQRAVNETPLARWGAPADVAQAALWLVSPSAAFVTGQTLRVNGGAVMG